MKNIAVIFGGQSAEHEISLISAQNIIKAIDTKKYNILPIGITKNGQFLLFEYGNYLINKDNVIKISLDETKGQQIVFMPGKSEICLLQTKKHIKLGVVFPVLHGGYGEDGTFQGLLKISKIPFVGTGILGSALGMDKEYTKILLKSVNIPVAKYVVFRKAENNTIDYDKITKELNLPIYIKPANAGSSVGISRVNNKIEFQKAIKDAFTYDNKIVIEQAIQGREIECSVLGNGKPIVSLPGEVIPKDHFYSYEAKYLKKDWAKFNIPVKLEQDIIKKIQDNSIKAYRILGIDSMARVDGFLTDDGEYYINEVNTIPGFTNNSMFPKLWESSGLPYKKLIQKLIDLAFDRFEKENVLKKII